MHNLAVDVSYSGAYSRIPVHQRIDLLPEQYWTKGMTRDQTNGNFLSRNVTSRYNIQDMTPLQSSDPVLYNCMSGQSCFTSSVIRRHRLFRRYGFMISANGLRPAVDYSDALGEASCQDTQLLVERRFTQGLSTSFMWTAATRDESDCYFNEFDSAPSNRPADQVRSHRIAWSGSYEIPVRKGLAAMKGSILGHVIGDWNIGWVYQRQGSAPTDWSTRCSYGALDSIESLVNGDGTRSKDIHQWFDSPIAFRCSGDIPSGFQCFDGRSDQQPGSCHVRMFPCLLSSLRHDDIRN